MNFFLSAVLLGPKVKGEKAPSSQTNMYIYMYV
jgi:hypothetical protein